VALACLALLLAACDPGGSGSGNTELEAGRANVEAMSREHANDTPAANAATDVAPRRAVVSERLPYADVNDELVYGHFVFPADMVEPLPAIIMIHEWWGLNDNIRAMAERLAGEGYIVLAVDLFGGEIATTPGEARLRMLSVVENPESASENIRQAYGFVGATAGAPRIGSLGWCFGGGWSLNTAMLFPEDLDATVIYYGQVTDDEEKLRTISAPILGLFGAEDNRVQITPLRIPLARRITPKWPTMPGKRPSISWPVTSWLNLPTDPDPQVCRVAPRQATERRTPQIAARRQYSGAINEL
jgi:carboxymethylenebutenolidase